MWKEKIEKCGLILYTQKKEDKWYVVSSYSRYMTGDQNKFINIKDIDGGKVNFGNNAFARIIGKGIFNINNGRTKSKGVLDGPH